MLVRGHGAIITTASGAGRLPSRSNAGYAAAKAGVVMITRHLARAILFLASQSSSWITGVTLDVTGGGTMV